MRGLILVPEGHFPRCKRQSGLTEIRTSDITEGHLPKCKHQAYANDVLVNLTSSICSIRGNEVFSFFQNPGMNFKVERIVFPE